MVAKISTGSVQQEPMVDAEGYTIPPPDRAAWPSDAGVASLIDDDFSSDNAR